MTKFHQNRSTLKGRSAGQRQTDRHTDRQTRLKIRVLQVCNLSKKLYVNVIYITIISPRKETRPPLNMNRKQGLNRLSEQ